MSSASTLTTVAYVFEKLYADSLGEAAMREHPLFSQIAKNGGFYGESFRYSVKYGNPQAIGGTFSTVQANAGESKGVQFEAYRKAKYGVITLMAEAIAAAEGSKGALVDLVSNETDSVLSELIDSLAFDLYRDGTGRRGTRSGALAGNVVTLTVASDARNFKVGMYVIADDTADGLSPRSGTTFVTAVDEDAGTVTLSNAAAILLFAAGDHLFRAGDPGTCMEGLALTTPLAAPVLGSDSFRGKDRGVDPARLAGSRLDDTATNIEENAGRLAVKISTRGKKANGYYLSPDNFWTVARRLGAKVEYQGGGGTADYGFEYLTLHTPAGSVRTFPDADCPANRGYLVQSADHYIRHLKELPHIVTDDGKPSLRQTADDGIEVRVRSWCNYIQSVPASFGVHSI
jgi:hypothetical protein